MAQTLKGRTEDAACPILRQGWWAKGKVVEGKVTRVFETAPEPGKKATCYELSVAEFVVNGDFLSPKQDGKQVLTKIGIPEMVGLSMAINAAGTSHLQEGDVVNIKCTGETSTGKANARTDFAIEIVR
jgi:hypothetical protein